MIRTIGTAAILLALALVIGCPTTGTPELDYDGDGVLNDADCEPEDPTVHPGAAEMCDDGVDNDCDGHVDAEDSDCADMDGDGYATPVDCDDQDPSIHPGADEVCDDGVDNDCDDLIDGEDGACEPGDDDSSE